MDDQPESEDGNGVKFHISVVLDRDGFFRRACDSCGREFKTEAEPEDLQWALAAQCRRAGVEAEPRTDAGGVGETLRCPFCERDTLGRDMHTDETVAYLRRLVYRDLVIPRLNAMFSDLENTLGGRRPPGGFLSISIEFTHQHQAVPVRPIHGPDPADMKIVRFLCCGKRVKVPEEWAAIEACCYCKTAVTLI